MLEVMSETAAWARVIATVGSILGARLSVRQSSAHFMAILRLNSAD